MARNTTYSFTDIFMTFEHPSVGVATVNGEGIGSVNISWPNDNTSQEVAADGSVMTSKMKADNAQITFDIQQTSNLHKFLKNYFNVLNGSELSAIWASAIINISGLGGLGDNVVAVGVAPQKRPDQPYQKQGQNVTWTFMAANCQMQ